MKVLCSAACALVLGPGGQVDRRHEPGIGAADPVRLAVAPAPARAGAGFARASAARRTVLGELRRLEEELQITPEQRAAYRATWKDAKAFSRRVTGRRRVEMRGVIAIVNGIARRGELQPSRLPALWTIVARNREWWSEGPLLAGGQRVGFDDSELVFQYFPGQGIQLHPLANFGKLNALWRDRDRPRMARHLDELLALPAARAGGLAWEYYFWFSGGRPAWVSGMAQGTGLQAMSRVAQRLGRTADVLPRVQQGLGIFREAPPVGVRVPAGSGVHYLLYSQAPGLFVINGFLQSLVGLHDYARISADPEGLALFDAGEIRAREELGTYDTGAWSLYSRGTSSNEATLSYHTLTRDFLDSLCDRLGDSVYCDAEARFTGYLAEPPVVTPITESARARRRGTLKFDLSKISRVSVRVTRGGRTHYSWSGTLGYGLKRLAWTAPRRRGRYTLSISATDLAGNSAGESGELLVRRK